MAIGVGQGPSNGSTQARNSGQSAIEEYGTSPAPSVLEDLKLGVFDDQAFLIHNIRALSQVHNTRHRESQAYEKLDLLKGPNVALLNKLLNQDFFKKEAILNLTPAQISELVPQIRLFKQYYDDDGELNKEVEFRFPTYLETNSVLEDIGRGSFGIQSFNIESLGTTYYTADKQFKADISLYFQSFNEFIQTRGGPSEKDKYSFLDLVVHPPVISSGTPSISKPEPAKTQSNRGLAISNPNLFRIRAEVGWSIGQITANSAFSKKNDAALISAVRKSKISFFLYLIDHDININDNGTLTLNISYTGAFDVISRDVRAGIILTDDLKKQLDSISDQIKKQVEKNTSLGTEASNSSIENLKFAFNEKQQQISKQAFESIVKNLMEPPGEGVRSSKIYQTVVSRNAVQQFALFAGVSSEKRQAIINDLTQEAYDKGQIPFGAQSDIATGATYDPNSASLSIPGLGSLVDFCSLSWNVEEIQDGLINYPCFAPVQTPEENLLIDNFKLSPIIKDENGNEYYNLSWFYLGDLLEELMLRAFNPNNADKDFLIRRFSDQFSKRVKLILSDIEVIDQCTGEPIRVNLAHVPISLKKFIVFFYNKIINTRNLDYTIDDFIRDMLNDLVKDVFLNRSYIYDRNLKQNVTLRYINLAVYSKEPKVDVLTPEGDEIFTYELSASKFLKSNNIEDGDQNKYFFYLMIYQDTYDPNTLKGDYSEDHNRGIAHIYMGRDRGIVKKVTFKKNPIPYLREQRIAAQGKSFDPALQLASNYNVDMETYGNTLFLLGTYFYLIPTGMGSKLGLPNDTRSYANLMGLGGYYFVNKIVWSLESGKYITNITAIHQATGAPGSTPNDKLYARGNNCIGITD